MAQPTARSLFREAGPNLHQEARESSGSVNLGRQKLDQNRQRTAGAEKGQKMADGTKRVRNFFLDIKMLGWLGNLDSNQD